MIPRPVDVLFSGRMEAYRTRSCFRCGRAVGAIEDEMARREYDITALCPECQDAVFADMTEADE